MHEYDGGTPLAGFQVRREEKLIMDFEAVGGFGDYDLRLYVRVGRKPGMEAGKTIRWGRAAPAVPSGPISQMPTDCGIFQLALRVARYLPEASGAGDVSTPSPVVIWAGVPPATGTAQMWRRSMSFAFVQ